LEFSATFDFIGPVLQISLIDLLLSGDNAILIAMACRSLPSDVRRKAVFLGTGAAVVFRVFMTFAATLALRAPYLKLIGAILLLLIAIELLASNGDEHKSAPGRDPNAGVWKAIVLIVVADAVMSLDNVVAVAAAAQDSVRYLIFGLLLSVPILVFSSLFVTRILDTYPLLVQAGAALLGWIAGKTAVSDPAIAAVMETQSFGLAALAPVLGAVYVLLQGRILREQRSLQVAAPQNMPLPRAVARTATAAPAARLPFDAPPAANPPLPERTSASPLPSMPTPAPTPASAPAADPAAPPAADALPGDGGQDAQAAPVGGRAVRKLTNMDLTIMAGVAVPALGLVATLIYIIAKAIGSR
jgi:YjbE family integral membrane protein